MKLQTIRLGEEEYVAHFGMAAISQFCQMMNMGTDRFAEALNMGPVQYLFAGLKQGCRKSKTEIPWETWEDLSDYFDDNPNELNTAVLTMLKSLPKADESQEADEKKTPEVIN